MYKIFFLTLIERTDRFVGSVRFWSEPNINQSVLQFVTRLVFASKTEPNRTELKFFGSVRKNWTECPPLASMLKYSVMQWSWDFKFFRNLNDRENELCAEMLRILHGVYLKDLRGDMRALNLDKSGCFSTKSYFIRLIDNPMLPHFLLLTWYGKLKSPPRWRWWFGLLLIEKSTQITWLKKEDLIWQCFQIGESFVNMHQRMLIICFYTALLLTFCGLSCLRSLIWESRGSMGLCNLGYFLVLVK